MIYSQQTNELERMVTIRYLTSTFINVKKWSNQCLIEDIAVVKKTEVVTKTFKHIIIIRYFFKHRGLIHLRFVRSRCT